MPGGPVAGPEIEALILTSYDDDDALFSAIMAGAAGYVLKQVRGTDLVDTVRRVAAGQSMLDPAVTAAGARPAAHRAPKTDPALDQLTAQERKILELIGEGMTNRQIAERHVPGREDREELRLLDAGQAGLESRTQAAIFASKHPKD